MTTIKQLREMPVGTRIGGGFVLTVKMTKKSVQLPNKQYVHTVVLCDETGEMVADFLDPGTYLPVKKGQQIKIIVAEIQELVLKAGDNGVKLYVSQFQVITQTIDEYEADTLIYQSRLESEIRGKCRYGLVCSFIRAGKPIDKAEIGLLVEYIMTGE
jgi:hypothetical protein